MRRVKYAILGAGTSGLTAMGAIRKQTDDFVLINGGPLGTTCARVGCMPSKAMIQSANLFHKRLMLNEFGVQGGEKLEIDSQHVMQRVRRLRDRFTNGVKTSSTDGLTSEQFIDGYAKFIAPNQLEVNGEIIYAEKIIIATGSRPIVPGPWQVLGDKLLTSDQIFELAELPKRIAVVGLGIIGLELGQALSRLGVEVMGFEMLDAVGGLATPVAIEKAIELFSKDFPIHLGTPAQLENTETGVLVKVGGGFFEVDAVLASLGRRPNIDSLDIEKTGVTLNQKGMPDFNINTMQIEDKPLFIAGDVNGYRPILHEAAHEGKIAVSNAMNYPDVKKYTRKTPLGIAFTDPGIGFFGMCYRDLDLENTEVIDFHLERNNGRAIVMAEDHGVICLFADKTTRRLVGGEMLMPHAEHLTHLLAWAVEQQMSVLDLIKMPFYHPVLEEAVQSALYKLYSRLYSQEERGIEAELTVIK
ncbi:dihydrolipoyl dehydrogenase [Thiomicrorhabdus immobilis]|uniref:Dihydrolipoyl dehydrogenase n=1 Tax=Thiomicrorhabdus immobilis TaxID=2791037 RepID=A0ABM7MC48_9GAMM|nr:dihydrolipoyl dehydrogenase [Thiomicrorhabdus immobilis]BCN92944.1 dihydrolipoyl dehydrogenase [Thiomicrorhabdus immobilis]